MATLISAVNLEHFSSHQHSTSWAHLAHDDEAHDHADPDDHTLESHDATHDYYLDDHTHDDEAHDHADPNDHNDQSHDATHDYYHDDHTHDDEAHDHADPNDHTDESHDATHDYFYDDHTHDDAEATVTPNPPGDDVCYADGSCNNEAPQERFASVTL